MVDIDAEDDRAERPHQKAGPEGHERQHELGELAAARKKCLADRAREIAEDEKIVHLEKIAAGDADHRGNLTGAVRTRAHALPRALTLRGAGGGARYRQAARLVSWIPVSVDSGHAKQTIRSSTMPVQPPCARGGAPPILHPQSARRQGLRRGGLNR